MIIRSVLSAACAAALLLGAGCRYDPVPQAIIDSLPPDDGEPGPNHRPGQPCNVCHSKYGGATPVFAVAGTVYPTGHEPDECISSTVTAAEIEITDAGHVERTDENAKS
mgnify:CR=1 FL=1